MKFLVFLPVALAAVVRDDIAYREAQTAVADSPYLMRHPLYRRFAQAPIPFFGKAKSKEKPSSQVPAVSEVIDSPLVPGAKRKNIRYGPYRLPPPGEKNWESLLLKVSGMTDTFETAVKPCETCVILSSVMELQDATGKPVTDAWLHHGGVMMQGKGLVDSMCGIQGIQGLFEQGNEKTELPQADATGGLKAGYHIKPHYKFMLSNELVNMNPKEQWVWNNIAYDYVDGAHPEYKQIKSLLLSVGLVPSCTGGKNIWGKSNLTMTGQPIGRMFTEHSTPWRAPYDGVVIGAGGHLHDGGQNVQVLLRNQLLCDSIASYKAGAKDAHAMGSGSYDATAEHLSTMSACSVNAPIKKGDELRLVVNYDFNQHPGMKNNKGQLDEVMGMAGIVIAVDK